MNQNKKCTIDDLLSLFEDSIKTSDVLASKLMAQISAAITKERIKLNMTQTEFAGYLEVAQSQISRWEHGDYNFSIEKIADIAAKLELDVNFTAVPLAAYQAIDHYHGTHTASMQSVSFVFENPGLDCHSKSYDSGKLVSKNKYVKEESKYVTVC